MLGVPIVSCTKSARAPPPWESVTVSDPAAVFARAHVAADLSLVPVGMTAPCRIRPGNLRGGAGRVRRRRCRAQCRHLGFGPVRLG
jgi:hypothetical protein